MGVSGGGVNIKDPSPLNDNGLGMGGIKRDFGKLECFDISQWNSLNSMFGNFTTRYSKYLVFKSPCVRLIGQKRYTGWRPHFIHSHPMANVSSTVAPLQSPTTVEHRFVGCLFPSEHQRCLYLKNTNGY
jgi:hypothetical protein